MELSFSHLVIMLIIALLIFGPSRLEGLGSSLGKAIRGFKEGVSDGTDSAKDKAKDSSSTKA